MSGSESPSFFHGQPWSNWIEKIGRDKPLSDEEPDTEPASSVMRLSVDDIDLYGFCPERDTFYGVVCEICDAIVKPQVFVQHLESRHPSGNPNATGQSNNAATGVSKALMKTPYCKLSKLKKSQSSGQLSVSNSNGTSTNSGSGGSGSNSKTNTNNNHTPVKQQQQQQQQQQSQQQSQQQQQQSTNPTSSPRSPLESCGPGLGGGSPVKSPNNNVTATTASTNSNNNNSSSSSSAQQPKRKRLKTERSLLKDREYDPDRHCGVWNDETGKPCTRSLTCKAHTVSLRRTVAGRSKAFDKLLAEHRASKEPQNQARTAAAAAATAKVAAAELAVAPSTPAAPPPPNNLELEAPSSPPVLSLPDTYPLPQAVDLLYRCLAPHGSNKPTKLEEDFANELESSRRVDASVVNNVVATAANNSSSTTGTISATNVNNSTSNSVMAPISVVLPSLSPIQTDGLSPQAASLLQFSARNVGNNSNSPMSADQPASTPVVPNNQQQQPNEAKTAPPMDIDAGSQSITMYTSPASKSQVTVQISRSSQRNNVVAGNNYSSLFEPTDHHHHHHNHHHHHHVTMTNGKRAKTKHEDYSPNIQLVETVTPYTNLDDISWSNCHPEPLAVSRWLRINSSRKQYNFNIH